MTKVAAASDPLSAHSPTTPRPLGGTVSPRMVTRPVTRPCFTSTAAPHMVVRSCHASGTLMRSGVVESVKVKSGRNSSTGRASHGRAETLRSSADCCATMRRPSAYSVRSSRRKRGRPRRSASPSARRGPAPRSHTSMPPCRSARGRCWRSPPAPCPSRTPRSRRPNGGRSRRRRRDGRARTYADDTRCAVSARGTRPPRGQRYGTRRVGSSALAQRPSPVHPRAVPLLPRAGCCRLGEPPCRGRFARRARSPRPLAVLATTRRERLGHLTVADPRAIDAPANRQTCRQCSRHDKSGRVTIE